MRMNIFILSAILLCSSCSENEGLIKEEGPMKPDTGTTAGGNHGSGNSPVEHEFSASSTVGEVISNPAFEDFGYLLFPVDRNISRTMTLADISSSSVYVWYSHIQTEKTVEIINHLYSDATAGKAVRNHQCRRRIYVCRSNARQLSSLS